MSASIHGSGSSSTGPIKLSLLSEKSENLRRTRKFCIPQGVILSYIPIRHTFWGANIAENPPSVPYDEIMADDKGVSALLAKIVSTFYLIFPSITHMKSENTASLT